ncbi:receptor-transporting protein 2-like [Lissotriton helveticus]
MEEEALNSLFQSKMAALRPRDQWTLDLDDTAEALPGWKQYTLHASARFKCSACGRRWESSKVRMIFNIRKASRRVPQGCVKMRVFKQECRRCNAAILEEPEFMIENIDVAVDRLVTRIRKVCYGEDVSDRHVRDFITSGSNEGPHDSAHCEACQLGLCDHKPPAKNQEAPMVNRVRSSYDEWDALMVRGYGHLRDESHQPLIQQSGWAREQPRYKLRGTNHPSFRPEPEVDSCCPCVLL